MARLPMILASASPRRWALLRETGVEFEVVVAEGVVELDGGSRPDLSPVELALANAGLKARAVAARNAGRCILGADTVVALERRIFGKPSSGEEAREFLRALSGRTHEVVTGCVLIGVDGAEQSLHEVSRVTFRELTAVEIERYLAAVDVLDKAGGYALQEHGDWIVAAVVGSRANVIGLPVERLAEVLRERGV